jgi:hypothetical protein
MGGQNFGKTICRKKLLQPTTQKDCWTTAQEFSEWPVRPTFLDVPIVANPNSLNFHPVFLSIPSERTLYSLAKFSIKNLHFLV